jgi:hypothetical protein
MLNALATLLALINWLGSLGGRLKISSIASSLFTKVFWLEEDISEENIVSKCWY